MTRYNFFKAAMAVFYVLAGVNHFYNTPLYLHMMPSYLPWPLLLVYISGVLEIALGVLLWLPKTTRLGAWGLIVLLILVFPANVNMTLHPELTPAIPGYILWLRLPLQAVFIGFAYYYTKPRAVDSRPHPHSY